MSKHLPFEILCEIIAWLDPVDNRPDLLSLCRVSRACKQAAQPLLFKVFSTKSSENVVNDYIDLAEFTRTILARIDPRHFVRQLIVKAEDALKL